MSAKAWGQKRICSCGKIRFYDLNKTKIECPECAEIIDIDFLSNNKIEKNLLKKNKPILDSVPEKKIDTKDKKNNDEGQDLENETSVDIEKTSNLSVKEVIGEDEGKKSTNVKDTDN